MNERDELIISMYESGNSPGEIAVQCNCSIGTIYNALKRHGKPTRGGCWGIKQDFVNEVIGRYNNGESMFSIQKSMGINYNKVKRILQTNGIDVITQAKRNNPSLKERYFQTIDTPDKAYWIGWLLTDGCIHRSSISLCLQSQDLPILELFQQDLGIKSHIKLFQGKYHRFMFWSKQMCADLEQYGLVHNKTFTIKMPKFQNELMPHLLRGCLDGDGWISSKYHTIGFTGNYDMVNAFADEISRLCEVKKPKVRPNNSIYRVTWVAMAEVTIILEKLYHNVSAHRLQRKYDNFLSIKEKYANT